MNPVEIYPAQVEVYPLCLLEDTALESAFRGVGHIYGSVVRTLGGGIPLGQEARQRLALGIEE